jgi:hypothetical protein
VKPWQLKKQYLEMGGETLDQRGGGISNGFITRQLGASLMGILSLDRVQLCQPVIEV